MKERQKEIAKEITKMSGRYSPFIIFDDWVKCMALSIQNSCCLFHDKIWQQREGDYMQTMNKYELDERHKLVELAGMLTNAFEEDMCDMLGDIYMESAAGNKNLGQFFTPFHLSYACAACTLPEDISEDNPFHINEPSVGGGGMIIAAAKVLKERGLNYQRCMKVVGQDLDWHGVYMAYVQLSLLGIDAIVVQGNTLAEPYVEGYDRSRMLRTPMNMGVIL